MFVSGLTKEGTALLQVDSKRNVHLLWELKGNAQPWSVPLFGGLSAPWAVPSPDGRHLAICAWNVSANMWMMENF